MMMEQIVSTVDFVGKEIRLPGKKKKKDGKERLNTNKPKKRHLYRPGEL